MMATLDRADVARLIESYSGPELGDGAPVLMVRMSPQAALAVMENMGVPSIEAAIIHPGARPEHVRVVWQRPVGTPVEAEV
jgi:hypothetical protein